MRRKLASMPPIMIGDVFIRLPATVGVDVHRAVRPLARRALRRVGIVGADFFIRGIAVDHGIHVAAGDAEKQIGFAEFLKIGGALPVRLRDDANPKALGFQHSAYHRHAEAGMIDIGIAGYQHNIAGIPTQIPAFPP